MRMDRNENADGKGKYALLRLRRVPKEMKGTDVIRGAINVLRNTGILDYGNVNSDGEFFVIRLKDKYAQAALMAYAEEARADDEEWADEVMELALRSGPDHPHCKLPD